MNKTKVFVDKVLPCAGDLEVVIVRVFDENGKKELQLCVPKSCNISNCVGEEIFYEIKNGRVRIKRVEKQKIDDEIFVQGIETGDE